MTRWHATHLVTLLFFCLVGGSPSFAKPTRFLPKSGGEKQTARGRTPVPTDKVEVKNTSADAVSPRLAEIRYIGMSHVTPRDLESSLPFSMGDPWNDELVGQLKQIVTNYYGRRGFYNAKVQAYRASTPSRNERDVVLIVRVDEGPPCTIRTLTIDDPSGFSGKHAMQTFKGRMESVLNVHVSDRYDEQVLSDHLRELRDWLASENFILANTDNVRLTFNAQKTEVDLGLAVDYGDRVTIGFLGNTVFSKGELDEVISQLRVNGLTKDYVGVIQRRFSDDYKAKAYNDIRIETRSSETKASKHVSFLITEGVRTELQEIRWEGLSDRDAALAKDFFEKSSSRLLQRGYFVDKDFDKMLLLVLEDLKSRGYLMSKLIAKSAQFVKSPVGKRRVRVVVQFAQGEQTLVGTARLDDFDHFPASQILSTVGVSEGQPFNPFAFEEGLQKLKALYVAEGYLDFRIVTDDDKIVTFAENNRTANLTLKGSEGTRVRIGEIKITGLGKTRDYVVNRELTVRTGEWWLGASVQETEANIRRLGLFPDIRITPLPSPRGPDYRDMLIELKEGEPGIVEFGPGIRSDLGVRLFARASYNNILGKNWIGSISGESNRRLSDDFRFVEYKFDAAFVEPRFFGSSYSFGLELTTKLQRFLPDFNAASTEFTMGFERRLSRALTAKLNYKLEWIRQFDALLIADNRSMLISSLVPMLTLDTRDSPFATSNGWLLTGSLEYARPQFSFQNPSEATASAYQKWNFSFHRYTTLFHDLVWSKVVSVGYARSDLAGHEIPLIKLFRLGGYSTIRGFSEDAINADNQKIYGTLSYINVRTQIDLPFLGDLRIAPFVDAGNVFVDAPPFNNGPLLRSGAGVGLHYLTPVGPINLDWGYNLAPEKNESPYEVHFSVGLI